MTQKVAKVNVAVDYDKGAAIVTVLTEPDATGSVAAYRRTYGNVPALNIKEMGDYVVKFGDKVNKAEAFNIFGQAAEYYRR